MGGKTKKPLVGFIGQGFIGKAYADDFESRGFSVTRYAREDAYKHNKERIAECDIVFIAVPTPSTPDGFDDSILRSVVPLVGKEKTAIIKSTIVPGTTESIRKENPDVFVMHSPEFLTERTAAYDAAHPNRNIIGIPEQTAEYQRRAEEVLAILPDAPFERVMPARTAELVKYGGNCWFYFKIVYINMLFDLANSLGIDWDEMQEALAADPRIGSTHLNPVHASGHDETRPPARGAGGHCFIKDFAAFARMYEAEQANDREGIAALKSLETKNTSLLRNSQKDLDLLEGVYGAQQEIV